MAPRDSRLTVVLDGVERKIGRTFWRGDDTRFRPLVSGMQRPGALARHLLSGSMPPAPFIDHDTTVVAFGSCFAQNISTYLNALGFNVASREGKAYVASMGDGMVNSYAIRQQFEWAWSGRVPEVALWHGYKAEQFGYDEDVRVATRDLFDRADVFILTLGLSEIWYDEPTGEVFWRAVPADQFDASRHKFRVATHAENKANLIATYDLIRRHRPGAAIIFTLSPIPLAATFRPVGPFLADSVSKAALRCAVDEMFRERPDDDKLFYFPSFEVVRDCFHHPFRRDFRHPHAHILNLNMLAFERYFCCTGRSDADVEAAYQEAKALDQMLGALSEAQRTRWETAVERPPARTKSIETTTNLERRDKAAVARASRLAERQVRLAEREQRVRQREARRSARAALIAETAKR